MGDISRIKNFILDFDGVLADTESVFAKFDCDILNKTLEHAGRSERVDESYVRSLAGHGAPKKLALVAQKFGFDETAHLEYMLSIREGDRKSLFQNYPAPLPAGFLAFLDTQKGHYAIATNKRRDKALRDLEGVGLSQYFDGLLYCPEPEAGLPEKPAPDTLLLAAKEQGFTISETAYVGDNLKDMHAAVNAQMYPIGFVIDGDEERAAILEEAGAKHILYDFKELI